MFQLFLVVNLLENYQNILMTILAGFQLSEHCPLGFFLFKKAQAIAALLLQSITIGMETIGKHSIYKKIITDSYMYA